MSINVGDVESVLRMKDEFSAVIQSAMDKSTSAMAQGVAAGNLLSEAIEGIGHMAVEAAKYLIEMTEDAIGLGGSMFELAMKTGVGVQQLVDLKYVASQTGTSLESMTMGIYRMQIALGRASQDGGELADVIGQRLHLNIEDLVAMKPEQAFIEIVKGLHGISNASDRAAIGQQIFSRAFREMRGLVAHDIEELMKSAEDLGLIMSDKAAAGAHEAEDAMAALQQQLEMAKFSFVSSLFPAIIAVTKVLSEGFQAALKASGVETVDLQNLVKAFAVESLHLFASVVRGVDFLQGAFHSAQDWSDAIVKKLLQADLLLNQAWAHLAFGDELRKTREQIVFLEGAIDGLSDHQRDVQATSERWHTTLEAMAQSADTMGTNLNHNFAPALEKVNRELDDAQKLLHEQTAASESTLAPLESQEERTARLADATKRLNEFLKEFYDTEKLIKETMASMGMDIEGGPMRVGYERQRHLLMEQEGEEKMKLEKARDKLQDMIDHGMAREGGEDVIDEWGNRVRMTAEQQVEMLNRALENLPMKYIQLQQKLMDAWQASGQAAEAFTGKASKLTLNTDEMSDAIAASAAPAAGALHTVATAADDAASALRSHAGAVQSGQPGWTPNAPGPWSGQSFGKQQGQPMTATEAFLSQTPQMPRGYSTPSWSWDQYPWQTAVQIGWGLPHFAEGGRVTGPTVAMIGEREAETIIPDSKIGSGGGVHVSISIDARGANFQSPQAIAEMADRSRDALIDALRSRGIRV